MYKAARNCYIFSIYHPWARRNCSMRAAISTLIVIVLASFALPASRAATLQVRFESELVDPDWIGAFPALIGEDITGRFEIDLVDNRDAGWMSVKSSQLYSNGILLPEASWAGGVVAASDNARFFSLSTDAPADEVLIILGPASLFRPVGGSSGFDTLPPDQDPGQFDGPNGYGMHIRLRGPTDWFAITDSVPEIVRGLSNFESADSWIEYSFGGLWTGSTFSDARIIRLEVVPEPNGCRLLIVAACSWPFLRRWRSS